MIKMKRKIKGMIALGMTLAMSLGMVGPLYAAATSPSAVVTQDGGTDGVYQGKAYDTDLGTTAETDVWVDNDTSYTISVPKRIVLNNIKRGETGAYNFDSASVAPYVIIKEASLAPAQSLTVTVSPFTLSAKSGTATKQVTPGMSDTFGQSYTDTWVAATAASSSDKKIDSSNQPKAYINFSLPAIFAGTWNGTMTFTAKASSVGSAPTTD